MAAEAKHDRDDQCWLGSAGKNHSHNDHVDVVNMSYKERVDSIQKTTVIEPVSKGTLKKSPPTFRTINKIH